MDVSISCVHASKYGGMVGACHPCTPLPGCCLPAWWEDEVIAAGLLAPGFQLSARAETAVVAARPWPEINPTHFSPFLRCALHRGAGS